MAKTKKPEIQKPSLSRDVHLFFANGNKGPFAMKIVNVNENGSVNLAGWDNKGRPQSFLSVFREENRPDPSSPHWDWPKRV